MFMTIGAALFVLIVGFILWYYSMILMDVLWNNKYARKARREAIEALINVNEFLRKYDI